MLALPPLGGLGYEEEYSFDTRFKGADSVLTVCSKHLERQMGNGEGT